MFLKCLLNVWLSYTGLDGVGVSVSLKTYSTIYNLMSALRAYVVEILGLK